MDARRIAIVSLALAGIVTSFALSDLSDEPARDPLLALSSSPSDHTVDPDQLPLQRCTLYLPTVALPLSRGVFEDMFAGFAIDPPVGWIEHAFSGIYTLAPTTRRLFAYPDYNRLSEHTFTITVRVVQSAPFARNVDRVRELASEQPGVRVTEGADRVGGVVATTFEVAGSRSIERWWLVPWRHGTTIYIWATARERALYERFIGATVDMVRSLRVVPGDDHAEDVRAFLDARVAGSGAEEWLTRSAEKAYEAVGLYNLVKTADGDHDLTGYEVFPVESAGTTADGASTWYVRMVATDGAHVETFCSVPRSDGFRVAGVELLQAPDTS